MPPDENEEIHDDGTDAAALEAAEALRIAAEAAEGAGDGTDAGTEKPKPEVPKWAMDRIHEETNKRQQEAAARAQLERENREMREILARLQTGKPGEADPPARVEPKPAVVPQQEFEAAVHREVDNRTMAQTRTDIINSGYAEFGGPKFDEVANILKALNCTGDDFIADVTAVDRAGAHKLLSLIAADPENAARLSGLPSRSRIAELTRMAMTMEPKPAPVTPPTPPKVVVSNAPRPKPKTDPVASNSNSPDDLMDDSLSDDEWYARYRRVRKI